MSVSWIHNFLQNHHVVYIKHVQLLDVSHTLTNFFFKAKGRANYAWGKSFFLLAIISKNVFFI